jgi:LysR family transcriptional regulator for bpeEF and oprC
MALDRWEALRLYIRVVEAGSFSKAAKAQGVAQSTASKQVMALEQRLGVQLLRRTSRGLSVTDAGRSYYEAAARVIDDLQTAEESLVGDQASPSGRVRVSAPAGFGRMHVMPMLHSFLMKYPDLQVDLEVTDRFLSLVEDGIDVAIRIGSLADSSLIARRIGSFDVPTVASAAFLERHGTPTHPSELNALPCVIFLANGAPCAWAYQGPRGAIELSPAGALRTNDAEIVRSAVLDGFGLARAPGWLFASEMASGKVVRVLAEFDSDPAPIYAVTPASRSMARRARLFIDHLADGFAREPALRVR